MRAAVLWLSASALALMSCGAAEAQTTPADSSKPAAASNKDTTTSVGEVIVTAERRPENLMKTSIAASVLSGADLASKGIVNVDQLQFSMPNVTIDNFGQGLEFNIRGIGKAEHNSQTSTGVITYRDAVATFPGYFQEEPYFDIASVEVLRGPQGTIAGQNATGGAVFVNTFDPKVGGGVHGYLQGQAGDYNDVGLQGAVNVPISDTLAGRIAFYTERRDSFYHITTTGGGPYTGNPGNLREGAVRLSLLWKPSEQLSVLWKTDLDYIDMGAYPADPQTDRFAFLPVGSATPNPNFTDLFHITANSPQGARDKFVRSLLKIDYELGGGVKLRSISSYQTGNTTYTADLDGTAAGNSTFFDNVNETAYSQELNLISPDAGRFTWLLGAYAQWNTYNFLAPYQFIIGVPPGAAATEYTLQGTNPERSLAGFAQLGFEVTPGLKIELGGRYTDSRTTNHVSIRQFGTLLDDQQAAASTNFSYKASIGWTPDANNYLYGFVATGFRPGGLNVPVGLGLPAPFEPEKVTSFEAGWKANFLDGRVRTTLDGYYNKYRNFQVSIGYPAFPVFSIELNVPNTTKIYGFEADADAKFGQLSLDFGISAQHSELGTFFATDPRVVSGLACSPTTGPASVSCLNLKGRQQTYAPNFTFNFGAQYEFDLSNGDKLTPRVNFGHVAAQWASLFENTALGDRLTDRNILGAQLAWSHQTWLVTLYGTNLTNQHYVGALNSGLDFAGPPRQFGVKVLKLY
jgi:iron complex outermembrane receptor protein